MEDDPLRSIRANNPGPFTLDGTRTYIVGHSHVAVIDPGPGMEDHVRAVASAIADAESVTILVSHGHGDHVDGVDALLKARPDARVVGHGHPRASSPFKLDGPGAGESGFPSRVAATDAGDLFAIATPGHTEDHLCFHWPAEKTLFAADMVLGVGDTTWVAEYRGCVADWLESLDLLESLELTRVLSAHGPPVVEVPALWSRYRQHRLDRIEAARTALRAEGMTPGEHRGAAGMARLLHRVYGDTIPDGLEGAATASLGAVLDYVDSHPGAA